MQPLSLLLASLFVLLGDNVVSVHAQTVSLKDHPSLEQQRNCVINCLGSNVVANVGCGNKQAHACFCAEAIRPDVSSFLSSCMRKATSCREPTYYNAAASIFDDYCGFTAAAVEATPTATDNDEPVTTGNGGDEDDEPAPTATADATTGSGGDRDDTDRATITPGPTGRPTDRNSNTRSQSSVSSPLFSNLSVFLVIASITTSMLCLGGLSAILRR